jgi:hypothetical protein
VHRICEVDGPDRYETTPHPNRMDHGRRRHRCIGLGARGARQSGDADENRKLIRSTYEGQKDLELGRLGEIVVKISQRGAVPEHNRRVNRYGDNKYTPQCIVTSEGSSDLINFRVA